MGRFLAAETLSEAVQRLGDSIAQGTVVDYLIFKRALVNTRRENKKATAVVTGLESEPFQEAINEFTACDRREEANWQGLPFFAPFGVKSGFKSQKYPSNGPSDTIAGWQSRNSPPLRLVPDSSPKQFAFEKRSEAELRTFFIKKTDGVRPTLLDSARWWFRFQDVEARFHHEPSGRELTDAFIEDLQLSQPEVDALFEPISDYEASLPAGSFSDHAADPSVYLPTASAAPAPKTPSKMPPKLAAAAVQLEGRIEHLIKFIEARGFIFAPWQIAAFVTAARTKPFVILAGISGTGKTKLPRLIAEATNAEIEIIPVHPDWTDGSELIGYQRIDGSFVPGRLLRLAQRAQDNPSKQIFALLDEMNIARVEYYFADVLSHIEERRRQGSDLRSMPLAPHAGAPWDTVCLPSNLCIVGSVNMDETTHGFSRKVLDRSFVIEFSEIDLTRLGDATGEEVPPVDWSANDWRQQYLTLAEHPDRGGEIVDDVIEILEAINTSLSEAQLQVGYRVRDEIALFRLNARDCEALFRDFDAGAVDPLDLAIAMKILPRIQGGGAAIQTVLDRLREWANPAGAPSSGLPLRAFPLCQERIELMHSRLRGGFTSYWL